MKKYTYPLLYYPIHEQAVHGQLVGQDIEMVEKDVNTLQTRLQGYLRDQYKKLDEYSDTSIEEPKLKIVEIKVQPFYRTTYLSHSTEQELKVPVPIVFGQEEEEDHFICYLPSLNGQFQYQQEAQLMPLVRYLAHFRLSQMTPEEIYRLMLRPKPSLTTATLRVNEDREFSSGFYFREPDLESLKKVATQYPFTKRMSRQMSALPDAAWELEDTVQLVVDQVYGFQSNILLVGDHGVGKSAILRQAIRKITSKARQEQNKRTFWQLIPSRISASTKYLGEWEELVENMVEDLQEVSGILWVVNVSELANTGGSGVEDSVASFMTPLLRKKKVSIIGELTEPELDSLRQRLPNFIDCFQIIKVDELKEHQLMEVLKRMEEFSKTAFQINILSDASQTAYSLLKRFFPYEQFPGKAIRFLGECLTEARLKKQVTINREAVIRQFGQKTGFPELFLRDDIRLDVNALQDHFRKNIIGQPQAVRKMAEVVKVFKVGLTDPYKPIQTLLFAGPTGVGKTASAKALAKYFFGQGQKRSPLIRIDMSEFQHAWQIQRFIGDATQPGSLINQVRKNPFSVVLLDEIEKANRSIYDVLLNVLDEGRLTDALGRVTDFKNTIIIMTTNLGASNRASIGFGSGNGIDEAAYLSAIGRHFRPEFINRIDGVVLFNSLKQEDIARITRKELSELSSLDGPMSRLLTLEFSETLIEVLGKEGFDERYGARPLQRVIRDQVANPLSRFLLDHPEVESEVLMMDWKDDAVVVRKKV